MTLRSAVKKNPNLKKSADKHSVAWVFFKKKKKKLQKPLVHFFYPARQKKTRLIKKNYR